MNDEKPEPDHQSEAPDPSSDQPGANNPRNTNPYSGTDSPQSLEQYGQRSPDRNPADANELRAEAVRIAKAHPEYIVNSVIAESHSGPLPAPSTLAQYEEILPGAAERIMKMAEAANSAEVSSANANAEVQKALAERVREDPKIDKRQQLIFAALAVGALIAWFVLSWHGKDIGAGVALIVSLVSGGAGYTVWWRRQQIIPNTGDEQ